MGWLKKVKNKTRRLPESRAERLAAIEAIHRAGQVDDVPVLIRALKGSDDDCVIAAATALGDMPTGESTGALANSLGDAHWHSVTDATVEALVKHGTLAVGPLLSQLDVTFAYEAAMKALGKIGDPRAITPLIQQLESNHAYINAQWALADIGEIAVPALITLLTSGKRNLHEQAATILADIASPSCFEPLLTALGHSDDQVRSGAARGLGRIGDDRAVQKLVFVAASDPTYASVMAVEALGEIGSREAVPALIRLIEDQKRDKDDRLLREILDALGKIGDAQAVEPVRGLIDWPNSEVRDTAQRVLEELGWSPVSEAEKARKAVTSGNLESELVSDPAAVPALIQELSDSYGTPERLEEIIRLITEIFENSMAEVSSEALRPLVGMTEAEASYKYAEDEEYGWARLGDPDYERIAQFGTVKYETQIMDCSGISSRAQTELAERSGNTGEISDLTRLAKDGLEAEQAAAIRALGSRKVAEKLGFLVDIGMDPNITSTIDDAIKSALAEFGADCVPLIVKSATGGNIEQRWRGAVLLGYSKDASATEMLSSLADDENASVRKAAIRAAARIPGAEADEILTKGLGQRRAIRRIARDELFERHGIDYGLQDR